MNKIIRNGIVIVCCYSLARRFGGPCAPPL